METKILILYDFDSLVVWQQLVMFIQMVQINLKEIKFRN